MKFISKYFENMRCAIDYTDICFLDNKIKHNYSDKYFILLKRFPSQMFGDCFATTHLHIDIGKSITFLV